MAQSVFNKILGKKDKGLDIFNIPEKKYHHDAKKLSKMEKKQLIDEIQMMEKYISTLTHKLEQSRKQYEKMNQKYQQCSQKLNVLNSKMAMISNEHEQLQVKFSNLQSSLEYMTKQKQAMFKSELQFIESKQLIKDKINDLATVLKVYREQVSLTDKIAYQNKQLKIKYSKLEQDFFNLSQKIGESKAKSHNQGAGIETNHSSTIQQVQQQQKSQHRLILETKQQMIVLLNKKINEHKQKKNELEQTINQLYHQIHTKQIEAKQKQQETNRYIHQCTEYRKKVNNMKESCDHLRNIMEANKDELKKKIQELQKLQNQLVQVKNQLKLSNEQKRILISQSQNLVKNQVHSKDVQLEISRFKSDLQGKARDIEVLNRSISGLQQQKLQFQNKINELRLIERQNNELKQKIQQQGKKNEELRKKIENMEQNYQIKLKKLEFTANQQRIKAQGLKRSLTNLEGKDEQNRKQLDEMYEKKMFQDNKYAKMEAKLKQYKQIIQYLRKQKVELQKTFENKIRNMEEVVLHQVDEQDRNQVQLSDRNQRNEQEYVQGNDAIISKMKSKIVDLEEEIMFLKEQNKILHTQKGDLEDSNLQLQKSFKVMSQKRQQVMKQIKKLSSSSVGFGNISSERAPREQLTTSQGGTQRQKRIAEKSLKGFDILSKMLTALYKQFIKIHMSDIARKQIKELQGYINTLVNKCQDMKDIFQGYL